MDIDDGLRGRLKAWRKEQHWSQADVVRELENVGVRIGKKSYSAYEVGRIRPSRKTAVAIAKIFGRSIDDLLLNNATHDSPAIRRVCAMLSRLPDEDQRLVEALVKTVYETRTGPEISTQNQNTDGSLRAT